jgi:hypothetical protein
MPCGFITGYPQKIRETTPQVVSKFGDFMGQLPNVLPIFHPISIRNMLINPEQTIGITGPPYPMGGLLGRRGVRLKAHVVASTRHDPGASRQFVASQNPRPKTFLILLYFTMDPCMLYMVTFTINIPQMLAYIPYMDPMGWVFASKIYPLVNSHIAMV